MNILEKKLQNKLKKFDDLKFFWEILVEKAENIMGVNHEQAEAYLMISQKIEEDLIKMMEELYKINQKARKGEQNGM